MLAPAEEEMAAKRRDYFGAGQHVQSAPCLALKNVAILVMVRGSITLRDATLMLLAKSPLLRF
jgi:hypothetical protein